MPIPYNTSTLRQEIWIPDDFPKMIIRILEIARMATPKGIMNECKWVW